MDTLIFFSSCPLTLFAAMALFMAPKKGTPFTLALFLTVAYKVGATCFILSMIVREPLSYWLAILLPSLLIAFETTPLWVDRSLKIFSSVVLICSILKLIGGQP